MAYTANRKLSDSKRVLLDFDPDSTAATATAWQSLVALGGADAVVAGVFKSVGAGNVSSFVIQAATSSTGAGAATVVSHALGTACNAVGEYVWLEASGEQIRAALANATHIAAKVGLATATDECVIYIESFGSFRGAVADTEDNVS